MKATAVCRAADTGNRARRDGALRACALLAAALYVSYGDRIGLLNIFELKTLDWRFRIRGPIPAGDDIVVVAIDDYSIELLGRWPWPRFYHAELIDKLTEAGAEVIGFDIIFSDREESDELSRIRTLRQYFNSLSLASKALEGIDGTLRIEAVDAYLTLAENIELSKTSQR